MILIRRTSQASLPIIIHLKVQRAYVCCTFILYGFEKSVGSQSEYSEETGRIQAETDRIRDASTQVYSSDTWLQVLQPTKINNLHVITSGHIVENPTELLGSALMKRWMQIISKSPRFDLILIDTPPTLGFPDAAVISASLDAKVL